MSIIEQQKFDETVLQMDEGARENFLSSYCNLHGLTGIPSFDKIWQKYYSPSELSIRVPDMSLTEYVYDKNKDRLWLNALNYYGKKVTYEQFFENVDATSRKFQKYGVKESDYVGLAMPLTPEVIYMMYGLDQIGASANLIDPRVPEERMRYYLNLAECRLAAISSPFISTMRKATIGTSVERIINTSLFESLSSIEQKKLLTGMYDKRELRKMCLRNLREELSNNFHNARSVLGGNSSIITNYSAMEENGNLVIVPYVSGKTSIVEYTSGTTGIPKGLELSSCGMNVTAEQLSIINKSTPGETILAIMPPFISYGAVTGIHNSLSCGFEMILIPKFSVDSFADLIIEYKPNNIICVPSMFEIVINSEKFNGEDVSYIKRLIFGGDKTLPDFEKRVNDWLKAHNSPITLTKGGGMAEYSSCAFETPFEETKKPGIYGIPLPLVDAKIMKDDYTECGYYEIGEIYIRAPQEMKGYVNNTSETKDFFFVDEDGNRWGRSGDLGYVDLDGMFTLTSRKKQMIVRPDGHNVFPNEIESSITSLPYVKNCVVIGIKDDNTVVGEYPYAFIELKEEYSGSSKDVLLKIIEEVKKTIPVRDRPRDDGYILMNMIYTPEGKIDRKAMARVLKMGQSARVSA